MHTVANSPSESNTLHPLRGWCVALADDANAEIDAADTRRAAIEAQGYLASIDTSHCQSCGQQSCGNVLAGVPVPLCDTCLAEQVITTVGFTLARNMVRDIEEAEAAARDELAARASAIRPAPPVEEITSPFVLALRGMKIELDTARANVARRLSAQV